MTKQQAEQIRRSAEQANKISNRLDHLEAAQKLQAERHLKLLHRLAGRREP